MKGRLYCAGDSLGLITCYPELTALRIPRTGSAVFLLYDFDIREPVLASFLLIVLRDLPQPVGAPARAVILGIVPDVSIGCIP